MAETLPYATSCCTPCDETPAVAVPGPQGAAGADGADGSNGVNAFTYTDADFTMPSHASVPAHTVTVVVLNSTWVALNQVLYIAGAGYMQATALPDSTHITLFDLEYAGNTAAGNNVAHPAKVSPGGLAGADGAAGGDMLGANNLSELTLPATARTNLGLGTIATQNSNAVSITGGAITGITDLAVADGGTGASTAANARTNLGAAASGLATASGLTVSATAMVLGRSTAGAGAVEEIACTSAGRALIDDLTAAAQRTTLQVLPRHGLLGYVTAVNLNAIADTAITISATRYIIRQIVIEAYSGAAGTVEAGVYSGGGGGGTELCAPQDIHTGMSATTYKDMTVVAAVYTFATVQFRVTTPEGAALTANVWIFGQDVTP